MKNITMVLNNIVSKPTDVEGEYDTYLVPKGTRVKIVDSTPAIDIAIPAGDLVNYSTEELKDILCKGMKFHSRDDEDTRG